MTKHDTTHFDELLTKLSAELRQEEKAGSDDNRDKRNGVMNRTFETAKSSKHRLISFLRDLYATDDDDLFERFAALSEEERYLVVRYYQDDEGPTIVDALAAVEEIDDDKTGHLLNLSTLQDVGEYVYDELGFPCFEGVDRDDVREFVDLEKVGWRYVSDSSFSHTCQFVHLFDEADTTDPDAVFAAEKWDTEVYLFERYAY